MAKEKKENQDPESPKDIAFRLRQQEDVNVSPLDLSLNNTKSLNAEELQWINFYEPPSKLSLTNNGDTVMIRGKWPNNFQRPTLFGGPLDGHYVFSQAHFHWDSPSHAHATHTINGNRQTLEMHALFYKSIYQDQAEAQENEDGIMMVVYFFKVEKRSSFKWLTDQLDQVMIAKTSCLLPPAPLCALMVPFTKDYLAYWSVFDCSQHHVLWLVSRTPLRITEEELEKFGKVQSNPNEQIDSKSNNTGNIAHNLYQINSSKDNIEVLFPDATDPPCQISTTPNKITIAVEYLKTKPSKKKLSNISRDDKENKENDFDVTMKNRAIGKKDSTSDSDLKSKLQTCESNVCSECLKSEENLSTVGKQNDKLRRKKLVPKGNPPENDKIASVAKMKFMKLCKKNKGIGFWKSENELARRLIKKEREEIKLMKKTLHEQLKKLAENIKPREISPSVEIDENTSSRKHRSPIQKSVLTSKPKTIPLEKSSPQCEAQNLEVKGESIPRDQNKSPQSEAAGDKKLVREGEKQVQESKKNAGTKPKPPGKFLRDGIKSSLSPLFSEAKPVPIKRSNTPVNKRIPNRANQPPRQNIGKGEQNSSSTRVQPSTSRFRN